MTAFGQKRLVYYLAVPYSLFLIKHIACKVKYPYPFGDDVLHALGDAVDVLGEVLRRQALQRVAPHAVRVVRELKDAKEYLMIIVLRGIVFLSLYRVTILDG